MRREHFADLPGTAPAVRTSQTVREVEAEREVSRRAVGETGTGDLLPSASDAAKTLAESALELEPKAEEGEALGFQALVQEACDVPGCNPAGLNEPVVRFTLPRRSGEAASTTHRLCEYHLEILAARGTLE